MKDCFSSENINSTRNNFNQTFIQTPSNYTKKFNDLPLSSLMQFLQRTKGMREEIRKINQKKKQRDSDFVDYRHSGLVSTTFSPSFFADVIISPAKSVAATLGRSPSHTLYTSFFSLLFCVALPLVVVVGGARPGQGLSFGPSWQPFQSRQ